MWDILGSKINDGNKREERVKQLWEEMNLHDADVERFLNDSDSAWSIVDNVVKKKDQEEAKGVPIGRFASRIFQK
jgi:hypothetical protein